MRLPGVPDNIEELEGPIALSQFFAWGLHGILIMQTFIYYLSFPNDRRPIKWLVWSVFLADIIMTAFGTVFAYKSLAIGWGDPDTIYKAPWSVPPMPVICGFITSAVQIFYCWRIWVLSKNIYVPAFLVLISLTQCAAAAYCGINLGLLGDWRLLGQRVNRVAVVWLGGSAFCDLSITISMVFLLMRRREHALRRTESAINQLITYTIETGMIPAIGAVCELIFFLASTTTFIHLIFFFALAKLYTNSMMASLNARRAVEWFSPSGATSVSLDTDAGAQVRVTTTREQTRDPPSGKTTTTSEDLELNIVGPQFDEAIFTGRRKSEK